ncbi:hypothetical protein BCR32DRAFT_277106 [Anaeromyces robustus]|uniref:Uncharacterized protein n=1 Tax=Anaeromyces robustus TaxID=1754192 RepID=A0A1Y1XFM8_9FUNG|nr:hypothetical protein BCR32DRAFT_277106 [Anaeromyces robustus]|eukprot:ORX84502.1 hypothetical protein BCR32DRAFT_277106 [Anaeromyces robustus]
MNWKLLFLFFIYYIVVYCEYVDYAVEELAALILAAGNEDGTIAREIDPETYTYNSSNNETNYELRPILIDVSNVGNNGNLMDIQHIIPSLRGLEGEELNKKFHELYELATRVFNTFMDPDTEVQDRPANINTYDGLRDLIISKDKNESIGLCNNDVKTRILFVPNDSAISMMKIFIYNFENDDIDGIDMNDFDKLPENIKSEWKKEKFSLPSEELSKVIAMKCIKTWACKKIFYIDESSDVDILKYLDEISFNIVETTDSNNHLHYSVMIINNYTGQIFYVFTLTYDGDKYSDDKRFPPKYSYYDDISYNVGGYHITFDKENNSINREGINLIAACGTIFVTEENGKQIILKPKDYILKDQNGKIKTDDLNGNLLEANFANAESLKSFGENEENIICDRYDISYATIKMISKRFIDKRLNNIYIDGLTDDQLLDLNAIYQLMAIKDVFIDPLNYGQNGMLHYTKNNKLEYISQMSDFEESRYLASYTQSKLNLELKSGSTGLTNFATPVTSYDLEDATSTADKIIQNYLNKYSKRNLSLLLSKRDENQIELINGWIDKAEIYEKIYLAGESFSLEDSIEFLTSFHIALKELSNRQDYSIANEIQTYQEFKNKNNMDTKISFQHLSTLESYFNRCLRLHIKHFGSETLLDSNGRYVFRNLPNINMEASRNTRILFNLYENVLEDIFEIADDTFESTYESNLSRYRLKSSEEISKRDDDDISESIEINDIYMLNEIYLIDYENLNIVDRLGDVISEVKDILTAIEIHNNDENEPINGSGTFAELYRVLVAKYKEGFPENIEIQGIREIERDNEPQTKLKIERIIGRIDEDTLSDYILNNLNSKYYLKHIFNHLRLEISSISNENEEGIIDDNTKQKLLNLQEKIFDKLMNYLDYSSPKGHEEEGEHLLEVINHYNDLYVFLHVSFYIDPDDESIMGIPTDEIIERMEYIYNEKLINSINRIIQTYPDYFTLKDGEMDFSTYLETNANIANYCYFGELLNIEPSAKDYSKILGQEVKSIGEALSIIIEKIPPEQCLDLEKAFALKKEIIRSLSEATRNQDEIDDYENYYRNLITKSNNKIINTKYFEAQNESTYRLFMNFMRVLSYFDNHVVLDNVRNGNNDSLDYSSIYVDDNGEPILNDFDVFCNTIDKSVRELITNDSTQYIDDNNNSNNNDEMKKRDLNMFKDDLESRLYVRPSFYGHNRRRNVNTVISNNNQGLRLIQGGGGGNNNNNNNRNGNNNNINNNNNNNNIDMGDDDDRGPIYFNGGLYDANGRPVNENGVVLGDVEVNHYIPDNGLYDQDGYLVTNLDPNGNPIGNDNGGNVDYNSNESDVNNRNGGGNRGNNNRSGNGGNDGANDNNNNNGNGNNGNGGAGAGAGASTSGTGSSNDNYEGGGSSSNDSYNSNDNNSGGNGNGNGSSVRGSVRAMPSFIRDYGVNAISGSTNSVVSRSYSQYKYSTATDPPETSIRQQGILKNTLKLNDITSTDTTKPKIQKIRNNINKSLDRNPSSNDYKNRINKKVPIHKNRQRQNSRLRKPNNSNIKASGKSATINGKRKS